ncbi:hypothetical protein [Carboxylicivirga sp. N1Y90]|uniref:hypothetical protein n=1 Tax=Carboxylicivirga fragile TaxID=3417571 RepID=UPI003D33406B|nr:hypothetical protein [Marinilabiliaceae bacterium N1Y90]
MTNNIENNHINLESLTTKLDKEDRRNEKITKTLSYVYFGFSALYAFIYILDYILDPSNFSLFTALSGTSFIIAFTFFALLFRYANKEYREVNYALPTIQMLSKAAKRYKLFNIKLPLAIIAALFIDAGIALNHIELPMDEAIINDLIKTQINFFSAIGIGVIAGVIIWHIRQKPIRDNALALIKELEN